MSRPTVSICIPAYARPEFLRVALRSVLDQTFVELEVLIGDDSANLEPIVRAVEDSRVRYFNNSSRLGMARNWNALLDRARGDFIGLLGDDDRLMPRFVETVLSRFKADSSLGIVFTNHFFDEGGHLRVRSCALSEGKYEDFLPHFLEHMPVPVYSTLMRKQVWHDIGPLPDLLTADVVLAVRAALRGWPFFYLDQPLMAYRVHPGQLSGQETRFRNDRVEVWDSFEFEDAHCERLRQRYLARALIDRAATHLKSQETDQARRDILRSRVLDPTSLNTRARIISFLVANPPVIPATLLAWRGWRLLRAAAK